MQTLFINKDGQTVLSDLAKNVTSRFFTWGRWGGCSWNKYKENNRSMVINNKKKKKKEVPIEFEEKIRRSLGWNPNDPDKKKNKKQVVKKK